MERDMNPAEQLQVIMDAPTLTRPASMRERILGVASVAALYTGLAIALAHGVPTLLGVLILVASLFLLLRWNWFHGRITCRRPHTKVENAARFLTAPMLGVSAAGLFGDGPEPLGFSLAAAALPAASLMVYLALRWRR
ncbi:hypothetical protein [Streptomyces chrestomyceticus]|uniref:hypothetical protein n=1 Tax=Streptomyces chrestomyceticus TaxID=68185 RepID=UPI001FD058CE|nr:hypothetical protein [Streptomyces chrestomyceticus]